MAEKKIMYQGDLKPDYVVNLFDKLPNGTEVPVDLTTAEEVRVIGVVTPTNGTATPLFDRPASSISNAGVVTMEWVDGDTDTVGLISTEVEVMWTGSKPQTFRPPELVKVLVDLGGTA